MPPAQQSTAEMTRRGGEKEREEEETVLFVQRYKWKGSSGRTVARLRFVFSSFLSIQLFGRS